MVDFAPAAVGRLLRAPGSKPWSISIVLVLGLGLGFNEQIFGAGEQKPGRGPSD
jgi:hypothetical protein